MDSMNYDEFIELLATMSDNEFEAYVQEFGLTPAPNESVSEFRQRAIDTLR